MPLEIPSDFPKCPEEVEMFNALRARHSLPEGLAMILARKATIGRERWLNKLSTVKQNIAHGLESLGADSAKARLLADEVVAKTLKKDSPPTSSETNPTR